MNSDLFYVLRIFRICIWHQVPGMQKRMVTKLGREMCFEGICAAWTCNLLCWAVATASLFLATTIATLFEVPGMQKRMVTKLGREMCFEGICAAWTCNLLCWAVATASLFLATTIATLFEAVLMFNLPPDHFGSLSHIIELIESAHNTLEAADYGIRHTHSWQMLC